MSFQVVVRIKSDYATESVPQPNIEHIVDVQVMGTE